MQSKIPAGSPVHSASGSRSSVAAPCGTKLGQDVAFRPVILFRNNSDSAYVAFGDQRVLAHIAIDPYQSEFGLRCPVQGNVQIAWKNLPT